MATIRPDVPSEREMFNWRWRYGWLWAAFWLIYLVNPLVKAWQLDEPAHRAVGVTAIVVFSALYVITFGTVRTRRRAGGMVPLQARLALIAAMGGLVGLALYALGQPAMGLLVYIAVMVMFLFGNRVAWAIVTGILAATVVAPKLVPGWHDDASLTFGVFVAAVAMWGVMQLIQRNSQLAAAREQITRLAVADERNRFARDLHDILGHSLTVVAIKAELAGRLVRRDPDKAEAEIADVERLTRQALADVRMAVSGFRDVTLTGELAGAHTALAAAGIKADLPAAVDDVPRNRRELFGWAVREGVTNVVRHSGATVCRIRLTPNEIEIADDGRGPELGPPRGREWESSRIRARSARLRGAERLRGDRRPARSRPHRPPRARRVRRWLTHRRTLQPRRVLAARARAMMPACCGCCSPTTRRWCAARWRRCSTSNPT